MAVIKARMENMPTHEDITDIKSALSGIDATQKAAATTMLSIHEQLMILLGKGRA